MKPNSNTKHVVIHVPVTNQDEDRFQQEEKEEVRVLRSFTVKTTDGCNRVNSAAARI